MTMYIYPRSGGNLLKLLFVLIQLIGSTRPKFDVWPRKRSQLNSNKKSLFRLMKFDVWVSTWVVPILLSALPVIPGQLHVLFGSFVLLRLLVCINELREQHIVPVWAPALNFINSSLLYPWVSSVQPPKIIGFSSKNEKYKTSHSDSQPI